MYNNTTKVTGASQSVAYSLASTLAGYPGDVVFGVNNTNANYLEIPLSNTTNVIRCRYYLNPASLTFGTNDTFSLTRFRGTASSDTTHRMYIGNVSGSFFLNATSQTESAGGFANGFYAISKANPILIEDAFTRSSGVGVADATYTLWVDGVQQYQRTGFINYTSFGLVNKVWIGGVAEIDAGTSGSFALGKILIQNTNTTIGPYQNIIPTPYIRRRRRV